MLQSLSVFDLVVMVVLLFGLMFSSLWAGLFKNNTGEDFFMAGRSLRWWSVAGSIFGTNIHAQQIIGMMGVGFSIGFAQSHYEVLAVPAILVLSYIFIPIYRKRQVFTLSQFIEHRYNAWARLVYVFIIFAFILGQLIAGFYIGSRILGILLAGTPFEISYFTGIVVIAIVTILFMVFGGMESVVIADNILTVLMILALLVIGTLTYAQPEIGGLSGLLALDHAEANKMHLYLPSNHPKLPWGGIFTGLIIQHFFYWTTNQYQVQRVLAAKTDYDARLGTVVAGFLKLIIPFFSIAIGTAGFYLFKARLGENAISPDDTFLMLLKTVVPSGYGFQGLVLAGLMCAIFSAIYSMMNSVSTMLAIDVYKKYINAQASDGQTVLFGRIFVVLMCVVASFLTLKTYDPNSKDNFFLVLADQVSYLKPGLVVAFFWGVMWRKTNAWAAVIVLACSPFVGLGYDVLYNDYLVHVPVLHDFFGEKLNFLYRVFLITLTGSVLIYGLSLWFNRNQEAMGESDLVVSFSGVWQKVFAFVGIQLLFVGLVGFHICSPQVAAFPAAVVAFGFFLRYLRQNPPDRPLWQSDVFYSGLLTAVSVWILYFFA